MTCRIVYALCSRGRDHYSAMARISAMSVRISNPGAQILVLTDRQSLDALQSCRDPLVEAVDDVRICHTPAGNAKFRSRFIKTGARSSLDGQFILLDCDTLVRGSLAELTDIGCDIAGSPNHSTDRYEDQIWQNDRGTIASQNWAVRSDAYINTGVLLFNDTPLAKEVGDGWHRAWLDWHARSGDHRDQLVFNSVICRDDIDFFVLPHRFNAQFKMDRSVAEGAVVWHFYSSFGPDDTTEFGRLVHSVMSGGELRRSDVAAMARKRRPEVPGLRLRAALRRIRARVRPQRGP